MRTVKPQSKLYRITGFAALCAIALLLVGWTTNTTMQVAQGLQTANSISAPFNPYFALINSLISLLTPVAMFVTGALAHKSGVQTQTPSAPKP